MTGKRGVPGDTDAAARLFEAEAAYAESMFCQALGDTEGSIANAERALAIEPDYAPALLTVGSIAYQLGEEERGATLFAKLADLPDDDGDLWEILDRAGEFLIDERRYGDGLRLYAAACRTFPERPSLWQGLACCAGHEGQFDTSIEASRRAVELDPKRPDLLSDLGWSLCQAGTFEEAEEVLLKAIALDPDHELARENLKHCQAERRQGD